MFPGAGGRFADIKDYANTIDIKFMDGNGNLINTSARQRSVTANYMNGPVSLANLPRNFSAYTININGDTVVTSADIEAILRWTTAKRIQITDNKNIGRILIGHMDDFNRMDVQLSVASN